VLRWIRQLWCARGNASQYPPSWLGWDGSIAVSQKEEVGFMTDQKEVVIEKKAQML
jgi:hypothetical protein